MMVHIPLKLIYASDGRGMLVGYRNPTAIRIARGGIKVYGL